MKTARVPTASIVGSMVKKFGEDKLQNEYSMLEKQHLQMKKLKKLFTIYKQRSFRPIDPNSTKIPYNTCMHFYKRDLTPIREQFATFSDKLPYTPNFENYEGSLMSKTFKDELINNLGGTIRCQSATSRGLRINTFLIL